MSKYLSVCKSVTKQMRSLEQKYLRKSQYSVIVRLCVNVLSDVTLTVCHRHKVAGNLLHVCLVLLC